MECRESHAFWSVSDQEFYSTIKDTDSVVSRNNSPLNIYEKTFFPQIDINSYRGSFPSARTPSKKSRKVVV